ncbi:MAG TPA: type II secretion system protein GspF [Chromatiaceae bacterium]|jgi:general secretion pathway protein F|nr:type II secretion system protein GspF [Chromatiaceae bacterium]HIN82399.1 type II secretion system protein GspF [Chromatiales bacterium]HIO53950.1 type II secretion system protein GspF [Chromatiales bacterium]
MGAFQYTALDAKGGKQKGLLEGDNSRQVRQQLRDKGWSPLSVDEVTEHGKNNSKSAQPSRGGRFKISATELALITRQLATLIRSGLPLEESLRAVSQQSEKVKLQGMLLAVRSRVMEGHTLAEGFADFPNAFPELYSMTVAAGEQTGHLDLILERLADYAETRQQMHQKISLALLYPVILTLLAISVVVGLLTYVVPEVIGVFESVGQDLPALTQALISVSDFMVEYGWAMALAIGAGVALVIYLLKKEKFRFAWHRVMLTLPLVGKLTRGFNTARFSRTLSILTASGVPILEGLKVSAQVLSNLPMRGAVIDTAIRVREGAGLSESLKQSGYFTPMTIHLIASGEASGNLEDMLDRAATNQEREVESLVSTLLGMFEPLLILIMGGVVLIIVLAILLPIFDLNQLVQ